MYIEKLQIRIIICQEPSSFLSPTSLSFKSVVALLNPEIGQTHRNGAVICILKQSPFFSIEFFLRMIISALTDEIPETQENKQEPVNIICRRGAKAPPHYDEYSRHFGLRLTVS